MAAKSFSFASPGVFLKEIDQSQIQKNAAPIGPVVIGRALRGPAMRPVTVASYQEFVATFGDPVSGQDSSGDVWRSGIPAGPTYGGYAAQAWLANNPTLTYIRLLGTQSDTATGEGNNTGKAGWKLDSGANSTTKVGAYGLFVFPSASLIGCQLTGALAATWYCAGTVPVLSGNVSGLDSNYLFQYNALMIDSDSTGGFTVQMSGGVGVDGSLKKTFDFNPSSGRFIRKTFNTNPQNVNSGSVSGLNVLNTNFYGYWLGETFENDYFLNAISGTDNLVSATTNSIGIIMPLATFGQNRFGQQANQDYAARTGWIISQVAQGTVPTYNPATSATKLFRFIDVSGGDWIRNNLKVTINNITPPQNDAQKYATFDVEVRKIFDTDANKQLVESFHGCSLDQSSPNYIARKIGDFSYKWDDANKRSTQTGIYQNNSKFIKVEMASDDLDSSLIPFGVLGPMKYKDSTGKASSGQFLLTSASCYAGSSVTNFTGAAGGGGGTFNFVFPSSRVRSTGAEDSLTTFKLADWGATSTRTATSLLYNDGLNDLLRIPVTGAAGFITGIADNSSLQYAWAFSLDEIVKSGTNNYSYKQGSKSLGTSYTATGSGGSFIQLLDSGVNSFTTVFQGGTDGVNILEREPFRNTAITAGATSDNNYIYNTYRRAIDMIADPEFVEMNLVAIPGLVQENLTQYLTQIAEQRGDCLAVIDISGDETNAASYITPFEKSNDKFVSDRSISVDSVVAEIKTRNLNTSYGAVYYPWVQISDSVTGKILIVPPSIPAIGAMSYTDKIQAPWFAPAGFNRGGLSTGTAGVNVVNVVKKLNSSDRDKLYSVNINPITSFPNEGIVIFGQKTLQATPSALDRINVRRLMIFIKRGINLISSRILFEPNVENTWNNFKDKAEPFLADVKARFGLTEYKLILDSTTTTPDLIDQNIMYAKILLKPARAIEFIAIDFMVTKSGASFSA